MVILGESKMAMMGWKSSMRGRKFVVNTGGNL
jgi:hypothetical protein